MKEKKQGQGGMHTSNDSQQKKEKKGQQTVVPIKQRGLRVSVDKGGQGDR